MLCPDDFWAFACDFYAKPSVKTACLKLQNHHAFNVNLLLLCRYLTQQSLALSQADLRECLAQISATDAYLKKLREMRNELKHVNQEAYQQLLKAELALERQQQRTLITVVNQTNLNALRNPPNLECYVALLALTDSAEVNALIKEFHE